MTVRERTRFSPEYKDEAVRLVIESGRPIAEVARELHIPCPPWLLAVAGFGQRLLQLA